MNEQEELFINDFELENEKLLIELNYEKKWNLRFKILTIGLVFIIYLLTL